VSRTPQTLADYFAKDRVSSEGRARKSPKIFNCWKISPPKWGSNEPVNYRDLLFVIFNFQVVINIVLAVEDVR
jgi:hypothetical protein